MTMDAQSLRDVFTQADLIYDQAAVDQAICKMAADINQQLHDQHPIILTVLVGGIVLAGQLLTKLDFPLQLDYIHATRYKGKTTGGDLEWRAAPSIDLTNRNVLIVDDILDRGNTLTEIIRYCRDKQVNNLYTAVLIDKEKARQPGCVAKADFTGLYVENRYVFGYGMDYHEGLRNAPGVYAAVE